MGNSMRSIQILFHVSVTGIGCSKGAGLSNFLFVHWQITCIYVENIHILSRSALTYPVINILVHSFPIKVANHFGYCLVTSKMTTSWSCLIQALSMTERVKSYASGWSFLSSIILSGRAQALARAHNMGCKISWCGKLGVPYILRIFGTGTPNIPVYFARGCISLGMIKIVGHRVRCAQNTTASCLRDSKLRWDLGLNV